MVLVRKIIIGGYLFNRGIPPSRQIFYLHKSFQQITKMVQLSSLRESDQVLLSVVSYQLASVIIEQHLYTHYGIEIHYVFVKLKFLQLKHNTINVNCYFQAGLTVLRFSILLVEVKFKKVLLSIICLSVLQYKYLSKLTYFVVIQRLESTVS